MSNAEADRALQKAVRAKDAKAVAKALAAGADPYVEDPKHGGTLAFRAADDDGDVAVVAAFLDGGYDIDVADGSVGWSILMAAAAADQDKVVRLLAARGANLDYRAPACAAFMGDSALTNACGSESDPSPRALLALLELGADPDLPRRDGWTPLMIVASKGDVKLVRAVLAAGADPRVKGIGGQTALDIAEAKGHEKAVAVLREAKPPAKTPKRKPKREQPVVRVNNQEEQMTFLRLDFLGLLAATKLVGATAKDAAAISARIEEDMVRVKVAAPVPPKPTRATKAAIAAEREPQWQVAAAWPVAADELAELVRRHRPGTDLRWSRWDFDGFACASRLEGSATHASFGRRDVRGLALAGIVLPGSQWQGALADGVDFTGATLEHALMTSLRAPGAKFADAKLRDVDFSESDLRGASFRGADLRGADFEAAIVTDCDFTSARIEGAKHLPAAAKAVAAKAAKAAQADKPAKPAKPARPAKPAKPAKSKRG